MIAAGMTYANMVAGHTISVAVSPANGAYIISDGETGRSTEIAAQSSIDDIRKAAELLCLEGPA